MKPPSRKATAYVKALRRWEAAVARVAAQEEADHERLAPLRRKREVLHQEVRARNDALTGGQLGEVRRLLASPPTNLP